MMIYAEDLRRHTMSSVNPAANIWETVLELLKEDMTTTIKTWFAQMTNQERNQLVDVMFALLGTGGVDSALDIFLPKNIKNYVKTLSGDQNMRHILSTEFQSLIEAAKKTKARFG